MKWLWISLAGIVVLVAIGVAASFKAPERGPRNPLVWAVYTRAECTVRTAVQYPPGTGEDAIQEMVYEVVDSFTDIIMDRWYPVRSYRFGYKDDSSLYTIFTDKCDRKFEMVQDIVDSHHREYRHRARLRVTHDHVKPHVDTMPAKGPWWTDGDQPYGYGSDP